MKDKNDVFSVDTWRVFRIMAEFIDAFEDLSNVEPAVSIFGSARTKKNTKFYKKGEDIAKLFVQKGYAVITGGGPGIMEAGNKGATSIAKEKSIGLNIDLPTEQQPNKFIGKIISFRYFFCRKVMFAKYAKAIIILPGGYGTLDEFFELVTLVQTKKIVPLPIVLVGSEYWKGLLEWLDNTMLKEDYILKEDKNIFKVIDEPVEIVKHVENFYKSKRQKNTANELLM